MRWARDTCNHLFTDGCELDLTPAGWLSMHNFLPDCKAPGASAQRAIPDLIARTVGDRNGAPAVLAPDRVPLTYSQLRSVMDSAVSALNACGIGRNDRVAVVLDNGPELAVAFVAVAAGATFAPLNPAYRESEFDFFLSDMQAKALLVEKDKDSPARFVARSRNIPILELVPDRVREAGIFTLMGPEQLRPAQPEYSRSDDIALVLHTSGTTSRPKCVPLSHANICASAANVGKVLALSPDDRCLNIMPLFHIHGLIAATLASLAAGASVVATPGYAAERFLDWLEQFGATWYTAVPTMHQAILLQAAKQKAPNKYELLRLIRSSSAALAPQLLHQLEQTFGAPVLEAYGMTEAAHQMCCNPLPPGRRKPGSVGLPAGPEVSAMDATGQLLQPNVTGELVIRGENVMAGYERTGDNETAFTQGWFRTGDQGYVDGDGYVFITGRIKELINRGGEKISPREIDEALLEHPAVSQAVAFAVPHTSLGEDVAAAVVLKSGTSCLEEELREFAFQRLAEFKVPSRIVQVESIPKGPTGKLQRIGLHKLLSQQLAAKFIEPNGAIETKLAAMWKELLGLPRVGRDDNFFSCGGDSLLAARLAARIRAELGVDLSLPTLFRQPKLHALAAAIDQATQSATQAERLEMSKLLDEFDHMSDEEAALLLEKELGKAVGG